VAVVTRVRKVRRSQRRPERCLSHLRRLTVPNTESGRPRVTRSGSVSFFHGSTGAGVGRPTGAWRKCRKGVGVGRQARRMHASRSRYVRIPAPLVILMAGSRIRAPVSVYADRRAADDSRRGAHEALEHASPRVLTPCSQAGSVPITCRRSSVGCCLEQRRLPKELLERRRWRPVPNLSGLAGGGGYIRYPGPPTARSSAPCDPVCLWLAQGCISDPDGSPTMGGGGGDPSRMLIAHLVFRIFTTDRPKRGWCARGVLVPLVRGVQLRIRGFGSTAPSLAAQLRDRQAKGFRVFGTIFSERARVAPPSLNDSVTCTSSVYIARLPFAVDRLGTRWGLFYARRTVAPLQHADRHSKCVQCVCSRSDG